MTSSGLLPNELALLRQVFQRHPEVTHVKLFGHRTRKDIDLVMWGNVDHREVTQIADELDDLSTPYSFDLQHFESIKREALREQIQRVAVEIYANPAASTRR